MLQRKKEVFRICPETGSQVITSVKEPAIRPSLLSMSWRTSLSRNVLDNVRGEAELGETIWFILSKTCLHWTLHQRRTRGSTDFVWENSSIPYKTVQIHRYATLFYQKTPIKGSVISFGVYDGRRTSNTIRRFSSTSYGEACLFCTKSLIQSKISPVQTMLDSGLVVPAD